MALTLFRRGLLFAARLPTSGSGGPFMSKPLVVSIPHRLGKAEAVRRLKAGLATAQSDFKHVFTVQEETWVGDNLTFRLTLLRQPASGVIYVREDHVGHSAHPLYIGPDIQRDGGNAKNQHGIQQGLWIIFPKCNG